MAKEGPSEGNSNVAEERTSGDGITTSAEGETSKSSNTVSVGGTSSSRSDDNGFQSQPATRVVDLVQACPQPLEEEVTRTKDELRMVKAQLLELDGGQTTATAGQGALGHTSSGDSFDGKKGLGFYDLNTAIRMLRDYIDDLRKSNIAPDVGVQIKIQEYEGLCDELKKAKLRDPDNFENKSLTGQQRDKLIEMLQDYRTVLEQLDQNATLEDNMKSSSSDSKSQSRHVGADTELVSVDVSGGSGERVPLYLSDTDFSEGVYIESLDSALVLCDTQVQEFSGILPSVSIFTRLCSYLVETLSSIARTNFERYRNTLVLLKEMDPAEVQTSGNLRNSVSFCFESLVGLARRFQLVDDLLRKCGGDEWYKSALELANVRPRRHIMRWSEFSLAIRNSEWSLDIVELAFHALEKLLTQGTYTVKDASFRWSSERGRMVLQISGRLEACQNSSQENVLLRKCKDLEEEDLVDLIEKLERLATSEKERKKFFERLSNAHGIANFLSAKLRGPTPEVGTYVPYSFSKVDSSNLKYLEYLDKGSSGMVATYEWYGIKVAVKSVRAMDRIRFEQEAAVLAMAQHPNVVRLIGCGFLEKPSQGPGIGQLVMQLMHHDLRTVIDNRMSVLPKGSSPFSPIVAIDLMLQIAEGMMYLSEQNILHRDLKAKNVLVNICKPLKTSKESDTANTSLMGMPVSAVLPHTQENYVAKLSDFGLAKCLPQSSNVTTAVAGTTGWRAPEIFRIPDSELANEYRGSADVYSFAMTGYEIVMGRSPFEGKPNYNLHSRIMAGERPSFDGLRIDFPEAVKELIEHCWVSDPEERPAFDTIVKRLWECKVLAILPGFERKIMQNSSGSGQFS